jgi:hypothetical protein
MRDLFKQNWDTARKIWKDKILIWLGKMNLNPAFFHILEYLNVYMNDSGTDVLSILTLIYPELAYLLLSIEIDDHLKEAGIGKYEELFKVPEFCIHTHHLFKEEVEETKKPMWKETEDSDSSYDS